MEDDEALATGQTVKMGPRGKERSRELWGKLGKALNELGPCQKTPDQWKEYWCTRRKNARANFYQYVKTWCKTGHTEPAIKLDPEDERITRIFGRPGLAFAVVPELGVNFTSRMPSRIQKVVMAKFMLTNLGFARSMNNEIQWLQLELLMDALGPRQTRETWRKVCVKVHFVFN
ncbi:hypothetical protein QAD02_002383 [Eretmocerus hayati]|uniref:Uncharacterized protein n=1 Tax=Eretmocerus hayati TaxID=131215 RepID=A0ACC2NIP8_9HYME|nr:hypothetical protein QAD02_002383 [Eretmocerus hayati]